MTDFVSKYTYGPMLPNGRNAWRRPIGEETPTTTPITVGGIVFPGYVTVIAPIVVDGKDTGATLTSFRRLP